MLVAEVNLDIALEAAATRGKIISEKKDARRELLRLSEAIVGEVERARAEVMAEAELERETEGAAIIRIGVIGEEATKAVIEVVRVSFLNFAKMIEFTFKTREGQMQFLLFIFACAGLTFSVFIVREMTMLTFVLLKKFFTTPKLVREYGSSRNSGGGNMFEGIVLQDDLRENW